MRSFRMTGYRIGLFKTNIDFENAHPNVLSLEIFYHSLKL